MLRLLKILFTLIAVILRLTLRRRNLLSTVITVMAVIILVLLYLYLGKCEPLTQNVYPISYELADQIKIGNEMAEIKFRGMPSISSDGRYIAYNDIVVEDREIKDLNICLYDRQENKLVDLPGLNSKGWDISPSVSDNGEFITFHSNRKGKHLWNIYLYSTKTKELVPVPGLNSFMPDLNPTISGDGNFITFASLRTMKLQIYIYDRKNNRVTPIPILN